MEREQRVVTIPNLISIVRLLCAPVFVWLLADDQGVAAAAVLAVLGASDWVDGWIARHFDQGSNLGKVLDPVADRVLLLVAAIALLVDGSVPIVVGVLVLVREAMVSVAVLVLAMAGARRIDVQWAGKAGTFGLMFAFPLFLMGHDQDFFQVRGFDQCMSSADRILQPAMVSQIFAKPAPFGGKFGLGFLNRRIPVHVRAHRRFQFFR